MENHYVKACLICQLENQNWEGNELIKITCARCGEFKTSDSFRAVHENTVFDYKLYAWIKEQNFFYDNIPYLSTDNINELLNHIPEYDEVDKPDLLLKAIQEITKSYQKEVYRPTPLFDFPLAWTKNEKGFLKCFKDILKSGFLRKVDSEDDEGFVGYFGIYEVTMDGMRRIKELSSIKNSNHKPSSNSPWNIDEKVPIQKDTKPKPEKPTIKCFISYAHALVESFKVFLDDFQSFTANFKFAQLDIWTDENIPLGDDWHEAIQTEVEKCDIALLLVSQKFMTSTYIKEHEIGKLFERKDKNECLVIPIYFDTCRFRDWEVLSKNQLFKPNGAGYERADKDRNNSFCYAHLVGFEYVNGVPSLKHNPNRAEYMKDFVAAIEERLKELVQKRSDNFDGRGVKKNLNLM